MKRKSSFIGFGLVFVIWLVLVLACGDDENGGTTGENQSIPPMEYSYISGFTKTAEGKFITGNASGSLLILADGRYRHTRYTAGYFNLSNEGTYKISGDRITLTPDDRKNEAEDWKFYYSPEAKALSLMSDSSRLGYLLVMAGTEGMKRCENGTLTFDLRCE